MRRYTQLLAFLAKLDAALVQMETHPSEVYFTTPALHGGQSIVSRFDLTANFGYEVQYFPSFSKEPGVVLMGVFHRFCEAAELTKGERWGEEFFTRVWNRVCDDHNLQPPSVIPAESVRRQQAREIASTLVRAISAEAGAPDFAIPEQVINEFIATIADEQVFKLLLVRSGQ